MPLQGIWRPWPLLSLCFLGSAPPRSVVAFRLSGALSTGAISSGTLSQQQSWCHSSSSSGRALWLRLPADYRSPAGLLVAARGQH